MNFFQKIGLLRDLAAAKAAYRTGKDRSGTLIIRLDRIGDFALFAPFVRSAFSPDEKNYLLVNELWAELCEKLFPEAEVIPLSPRRFLNDRDFRRTMLKKITSLKLRRVIQARFYREVLVEELIALAARSPEQYRFQTTPFHLQPGVLKLFSSPCSDEVPYFPGEHELQRNARFAAGCSGSSKFENPWSDKPFPVPERFRNMKYVCVFPGSGKGKQCCWQIEKWGKLLQSFKAERFLITGTPAEIEMTGAIVKMLPPGKALSVTDLTLPEFAGVVSHAVCALGNDTGGIHLAAMSGVPSVAISGRGQPGWFLPYPAAEFLPPGVVPPLVISESCVCENCFWRCHKLRNGVCACVAELTVEKVQSCLRESSFSAFL